MLALRREAVILLLILMASQIPYSIGVDASMGVSNYNTAIILWITPWGKNFDPWLFPPWFIPGIVIPYDAEFGLSPAIVQGYVDKSLNYLRAYTSDPLTRAIAINFFCEKYYPEFKWRGLLSNITGPPRELIDALKNIIGDGSRTYMGFSELPACTSNPECRSKLVEVFKELRKEFPNAKLYYYGHESDDLNALISLYRDAGLDYIGIDLYRFTKVNDTSIVHADDGLEKLRSIASIVGWNRVFFGEFGIRVNDEEAYIEPWDYTRSIKYNESITRLYYQSILSNLIDKGVEPALMGIWSWNDDAYGLISKNDVVETIASLYYPGIKVVNLVPGSRCLTLKGSSTERYPWSPIGYASISPTIWGLDRFSDLGDANVSIIMESMIEGLEVTARMDLGRIPMNKWDVVAYPEVIYGVKPWGVPADHPPPVDALKLPLKVRDLPRELVLVTQHSVEYADTWLNIAYDIWLKKTPVLNGVSRGDVELMIWLYSNGARPAGQLVSKVKLPTVINHEYRETEWSIYLEPSIGEGWLYIALTMDTGVKEGSVAVDLTSILSSIRGILKDYGIELDDMYVMSIEFGSEIFYSQSINVEWLLHRYFILVNEGPEEYPSGLSVARYYFESPIASQCNTSSTSNTTTTEIASTTSGAASSQCLGGIHTYILAGLLVLIVISLALLTALRKKT